jgi:hypothetical protein
MMRRDPKVVAALVVPFLAIASPSAFQDFVPGYAAATLVRRGEPGAVYLPRGAEDLFQGAPAFTRASLEAAGPLGLDRAQVTAFVAPPPSLLIDLPLARLPYRWAARVWALGQAALACFGLVALDRRIARGGRAWGVAVLAFAPVMLLVGVSGQSSCLLLAAACAFALPSGRLADAALAVSLSAAVAFKLWPAPALLALPFLGRPRAAAYALACIGAWAALAVGILPRALFPSFAASFAWMAGHVVPDAKNLSFESVLLRMAAGRSYTNLVAPSTGAALFAGAARGALAVAFGGAFVRRRPSPELAWAGLWASLLAFSPLLWDHYLVVVPALLFPVVAEESAPAWRRRWALVALAVVGAYGFGALLGAWRFAPPALGLLVFLDVVACVAVACWAAPPRAGSIPRP